MTQSVASALIAASMLASSFGAEVVNLNPFWRFHVETVAGEPWAANYDDRAWDVVSLPHSMELFPANLDGFREHGREAGWYRRELDVPEVWLGKKLFLEFRGAMQTTALWVNGAQAGQYAVSGFDSFDFDITPYIHAGRNLIAVRVDNRPNREIPPDGQTADYLLFGGLYRDVYLHVTEPMHLTFPWEARQAGVRLTLPEPSKDAAVVEAQSTVRNESDHARTCTLITEVLDGRGSVAAVMRQEQEIAPGAEYTFEQRSSPILKPHLWSPDDPYLYHAVTKVLEGGRELDRLSTPLGIRWVKFDKEKGFFLNGKNLKLIGANRHQMWPFIGNAVPDGLQRRDAEQLKAMGVNWVRLSHYPQDPAFLDALDELGLMALEEPPTWMSKGPPKWMANLEASFRSMVRRDRNHPCIILWSCCINHHTAEPALVRAAIEEDPTRDRGQDTVPIPTDFRRLAIPGGGSLATEHTGHTFPAERGSRRMVFRPPGAGRGIIETNINREYEQAVRHLEQVNAAYQEPSNAGLAVWCMYDYNSLYHEDEAGIAHHGVCDIFRIPKYSYYWHQSELTTTPMAYIVRIDSMHAAVFSNCEQVRLLENAGKGWTPVATRSPGKGFTGPDGREIPYALHHPPFHFNVASTASALKAEGLVGGVIKATYEWKQFASPAALRLEADRSSISADGADMSRVIVTAVDKNGTPVNDCTAEVSFTLNGLGQLIGENPVKLRAGKMIVLAQSGFVPGKLTIEAASAGLSPAQISVQVLPVGPDVDLPKDLPVKQPTQRKLMSSHSFGSIPEQGR